LPKPGRIHEQRRGVTEQPSTFAPDFRIQNMKIVDGKPEYKGAVDVITKVARNEGFFALWKGFTPYYFR
jgi:hypothetical protein